MIDLLIHAVMCMEYVPSQVKQVDEMQWHLEGIDQTQTASPPGSETAWTLVHILQSLSMVWAERLVPNDEKHTDTE